MNDWSYLGAWEEYGDAVWMCRDGVREVKVQMELNLARDVKNSKNGFFSYVWQKREANIPLINEKRAGLGLRCLGSSLSPFSCQSGFSCPSTSKWGSGKQNPSHCNSGVNLKPPHEAECVKGWTIYPMKTGWRSWPYSAWRREGWPLCGLPILCSERCMWSAKNTCANWCKFCMITSLGLLW